ncbi:unnamed protein product [Laminaria digitata]
MAASSYLLELDQRRERILSDVVDCLGIPTGSTAHELALSFAARSLAHHDQLDAETQKVETAVCGFAEKVVLLGRPHDATRLLNLASALTCKPMRLTGHSMTAGTREGGAKAADPFRPSQPPLEHPYGALALVLALSGSQRWPPVCGDQGQGVREREESAGEGWNVSDDQGRKRERLGERLNTSRLWSTDSEEEGGDEGEEEEGGGEHGQHDGGEGAGADGGRGRLSSLPGLEAVAPQDGGESDGGTSEWLKAFDSDGSASDGELSPHTDGQYERPASFASRVSERPDAHALDAPPTAPEAAAASSSALRINASGRRPIAASRPIFRHNFGAPCVGADIRSLNGGGGGGGSIVVPFLRPCQTLEACQNCQSYRKAGTLRRRSIPEAEVVRAALHMLQGLAGDIFVRVGPDCHEGGGGERPRKSGLETAAATARHPRFSLSASAASGLAVASLSPIALAGVLGDFVRIGNVAEHLRAFTEDAEASAAVAAAPTATAVRERSDEPTVRQGRFGNGSGRSGGSGETLLGLLSLLRREAESLEVTLRLVRAGAGWWVDTPPGEGTRPGRGAGGLRERTGRLLAALHDELVSDALVRRPPLGRGTPAIGALGANALDANALDAPDALAPLRPGWLLRVFCEVLTPYLRLVDSWITEGRISDPHGELFFSRIGGGGGRGDGVTSDGGRVGGGGVADGEGGGTARGDGAAADPDPVVHVWDAGIVLHSKALPPFLAVLAPAVALAGQDISLMRRVRALIVSSSDGSRGNSAAAAAEGTRMRWVDGCCLRPSGIGSGMSRDSESLSLATALVESVRRLAVRVRHANAAAARREGRTPPGHRPSHNDGFGGGGGGGGGEGDIEQRPGRCIVQQGVFFFRELGGRGDGRSPW